MTPTDAHLDELSDDQRQLLEAWVVEFELSWNEDRLALSVRRLPPMGNHLRRSVLVEMVRIDLERRWQRGQRVTLDSYLKALPELGTADRLPAELLVAEYEAREQYGAPADLDEFVRHFPRQAEAPPSLGGPIPGHALRLTRQQSQESTILPHAARAARAETASPRPPSRSPCPAERNLATPLPGDPPSGDGVALPQHFGRYRIVRELGRGAMGIVYLAHDSQLDRMVALKVPQFNAADGPEVRQRFLREARAAATIEHPNVCPVYDVGEINGTLYLTMAYLQGQPLTQLLKDAPLPQRQATALVRQLALALQAAHEHGIIHRDLKPDNIVINQRGEPIILDFGLARRLRKDGDRLTQYGQPVGTPAYMSPEQVAGVVDDMGPGCDVYALGVLLYQLLTGRLPFDGPMVEVLGRILTQPPVPPSLYRPDLDHRLDVICLKAMSKKAADRYTNMQDLDTALSTYLRCTPPSPALPSPQVPAIPAPPAGWLGRKMLWLLLAAACTGAAVTVAAVLLMSGAFRSTDTTDITTRIELDGPSAGVEVQVDGNRLDSDGLNRPLLLAPGKHHLLITGAKIQTVNTSFTLAPGDKPVLRVPLVPQAEATAVPVASPIDTPRKKREHDDDDDDDDRKDDRKDNRKYDRDDDRKDNRR
jgi:predicted Ser/Thr protein kinase